MNLVLELCKRLIREWDDSKADARSLSNFLAASRADVARLVESVRDLEINMYRLQKGIEGITSEVNHLRHLDSMKQIELDQCKLDLENRNLDYKKLFSKYDFFDET